MEASFNSPIRSIWTRLEHAFLWLVFWLSEEFD